MGYLAADPAAVGSGIGHDTERPAPGRHALCQPGRRPGNENLRAGLTQEVLSQIARFKELSVLGRETSRSTPPDANAVRIHRELGVRYVLEGSVRTAEHQLRVTGRLLDAETGVVLWSHAYDDDLRVGGFFAIQDDVAQKVASVQRPCAGSQRGVF